tara:strand:- start:978 stop:1439 length:462 start_codon:yes stop_codon:yes gene_type:complete
MKTVDVSSMFEKPLPKITHTVYRVWENESTCNDPLKTTLTQAVTNRLRDVITGEVSLTFILVDKREDIERLPIYHNRYLLNGKEIDESVGLTNPDTVISDWTEHKEEWTKDLELEKCHYLIMHFTNGYRYTDEECERLLPVSDSIEFVSGVKQ